MSGGRQRQGYIAANWGAVEFYVNCRGLHRTLLTVNMPFEVFFVVQHFVKTEAVILFHLYLYA